VCIERNILRHARIRGSNQPEALRLFSYEVEYSTLYPKGRSELTLTNNSSERSTNPKTYKQLFKALSTALYFDQDRKRYHGFGTALIGKKLSEETGLASSPRVFYAGLIHDLGGIGLTHHVVHYALTEPENLGNQASSELEQVKRHGPIGADKIESYEGFQWAVDPLRDHHERYDGTGFPEGKSGEQVSTEAGLLGAADTLDLYLQSLERKNKSRFKEDNMSGFADFLQTHGGFRKKVREGILEVVSDDRFIYPLLSIQNLERLVTEATQELTPPGGIHLDGIIELLGSVIDVKSNYTEDHSRRVARLGQKIGKRLGMTDKELRDYRYAAYLHDLGKVGIDREIINKPDDLTEGEYERMKKHPEYSEMTLSKIGTLQEAAKMAGHHHEKYDGTGYPRGLKGDEITLGARILSVIDAWDAMTSDRPYRDALSEQQAARELKENSGSQFDPEVVEEFLKLKKKL